MKKTSLIIVMAAISTAMTFKPTQAQDCCQTPKSNTSMETSKVYFTKDISAEGLVKIYEALGVKAFGHVAVKISTGESKHSNHLRPELIKDLVSKVNGTLVECNTAYGGSRGTTEKHRKAIAERGYDRIAKVDIMDEKGSINIPVKDTKHLKYDIVGRGIEDYDFMINLAHFKGHAMGGFGGVLKNQSIGVASSAGKLYIHSAGATSERWKEAEQDSFLESMAAAAQAVHDFFKQEGKNIIYINVMNNMSVDCDCDGHPAKPRIKDIGILASTDPVALDKACLDLVFNHEDSQDDDSKPLQERINRQHGTYIIPYAEQIGLGSSKYQLVNIDDTYETDTFTTKSGKSLKFHALMHACIRIEYDGKEIEIDPVGKLDNQVIDYSAFPKADYIFVTHEHFDHLDKEAIKELTKESTQLITNPNSAEILGYGKVMSNGDQLVLNDWLSVEAVPAYNITDGHLQFHPKGRDNGYILTIDGLRIYVAGDTEDIPEMAYVKNIDIAFLPCNQPYTMTVDQCVKAAKIIKPRVLFPYHYSKTDLSKLQPSLKDEGIEVRIRHYE